MSKVWAIIRMELLDVRRSRLMAVLLGFFLLAAIISVVVASIDFGVKADAYKAYTDALAASGNKNPVVAPQLFPLQLMRAAIEYLEILGALFAIILGYAAIAKEKQRGTLSLLFTRPIGPFTLGMGKLGALAIVWLAFVAVVVSATMLTAIIAGHAQLTSEDLGRLLLTILGAWLYLLVWTAVSMAIASWPRQLTTALIISIVLWLLVVLVIPQIGDTMDPDNQVPGGLFKSLQIAKPDEVAVLANFSGYNNARDALEVSSVTKHFERYAFAFLGIKDQYNQQPIGVVWAGVFINTLALWLFAIGTIGISLLTSKPKTLLRTSK